MEFHRRRTVAAVVIAGLGAACSTPFPDDTAEIRVAGRTISVDLDACGLGRDTVFLVGRTDDDQVLQAVVGVEAADDEDGYTAVAEGSGLTFTDDGSEWAAFGDVAWQLRDGEGETPGAITAADVNGSRVTIEASAVTVDDGEAGNREIDVTLEARCDAARTA